MHRNVVTIRTPEQVEIEYELAGLGSRFVACLLDTVIVTVGMIVLAAVAMVLFSVFAEFEFLQIIPAIILGATGLVAYILYYIICEMRMDGQSIGKRITGLRVIRDDGRPISLSDSILRNLLRIVDFLPGSYAVGLVAIWFSGLSRRLGDHAAGTIVVKERRSDVPESAPEMPRQDLSPAVQSVVVQISALDRGDIQAARRFLDRRDELDAQTRTKLASRIASALQDKLQVNRSQWDDPEAFIEDVAAADSLSRR